MEKAPETFIAEWIVELLENPTLSQAARDELRTYIDRGDMGSVLNFADELARTQREVSVAQTEGEL